MRAVTRSLAFLLFLGIGCSSPEVPLDGSSDAGPPEACDPNPCMEPGRTACVEVGLSEHRCECDPGLVDRDGRCEVPTTCEASSCSGHGACAIVDGAAVCTCDAGYAGASCESCEEGFHDDGAGGCTSDACVPDPCAGDPSRRCVSEGGAARCECIPGFHDEAGTCVADTTCLPGSCAGHGTCTDDTGAVVCACELGYTGRACAECDVGYHDDGAGGCTMDPCTPNPCTTATRTICTPDGSGYLCGCDPGYHAEGGSCVIDEVCELTTCGGHGSCSVVDGRTQCACDTGWSGAGCAACDAAGGYHDDGAGGCTTDACSPDPCAGDPTRACVVEGGTARCACAPGHHVEGSACVADTSCTADSCAGHGSCDDALGYVVCTCDAGYTGASCASCASGYHPDGAGGCTTDVCTPNPCVAANRTVCSADGAGGYVCSCDAGYHLEGTACVVDEVCLPTSCSGHGTCSVSGGRTVCACSAGYAGPTCGACATGYHDDGAGGCTSDPCTPNPCTLVPLRTVCSPSASGYTCACQPGYHDDGVGGCTNDPCVPDPCTALGQACRTSASGGAECYTPVCDDGEPCTVDTYASGGCVFTPRANGTACDTTLCISGEVCTSGVCGGGTPVVCNDGNPCTRDSCDAISGCGATIDDSIVPDDGVACTVDDCAGGVASNTPSNAICDDGLYCTGVESCTPGASGADARGCTVSNVPTAPFIPTNECAYYGACSESLRGFPFVSRPAGSTCNDGITCTSGDACVASGACVGSLSGSCDASGACTSTSALGGTIDVPVARVRGTVTMRGGMPLPDRSPSPYEIEIYLVARDTGAWHRIHLVDYAYDGSGLGYRRDDPPTFDTLVVPGVYDVLFERAYDGAATRTVQIAPSADTLPHGLRVLRSGVVIGPGDNALDVDVSVTDVSGTVRMRGGMALPDRSPSPYEIDIYLVSNDTGAWHRIHTIDYAYDGSGLGYLRDDPPTYATHVPAGTYDVMFARAFDGLDTNTVQIAPATDTLPHGLRVLAEDVVLGPGARTLDVDIPVADITGTVTINGGAALPERSPSPYEIDVYLVARDTGAWHRIHTIDYAYDGSGLGYRLDDSPSYTTHVPAGAYDVLFSRAYDGADTHTVQTAPATDTLPHGLRILAQNVVLGPDASALNVDIPVANVTGTVTSGGVALPERSPSPYEIQIYLVSNDTGAWHRVHMIDYAYDGSGLGYRLDDSPAYTTHVPAGTYDVLFSRAYDGRATNTVQTGPSTDTLPHGLRILANDVVLGAGANTLNVDIPVATVNGVVTLQGASLPERSPSPYEIMLYLVPADTGAWHRVHMIDYAYDGSGLGYRLDDPTSFTTHVPPGTYDVLYSRAYDGAATHMVQSTPSTDTIPHGLRFLSRVVLGSGANAITIDIPRASVTGTTTVGGNALPLRSPSPYELIFSLRARDTRADQRVHLVDYAYDGSGLGYRLDDPPTFATSVVPGAYDVLYSRAWDGRATNMVQTTPSTDTIPHGYRILRQCVAP